LAADVVALLWANSRRQASTTSFWATPLELPIGPFVFEEDLGDG
jgi:hypothetical protein